MREVKFRAWDTKHKKWYGIDVLIDGNGNPCYYDNYDNLIPMEDCEIVFYTGIKDKEGKEIYCGDIIKISRTAINEDSPTITDVYFHRGAFRWRHNDGSGSVVDFNSVVVLEGMESITQDVEIIGNVFENPELIEVKK